MKISIRIKDKGAEDFRLQEIKRIENVSNQDIELIAKRCESVIRYMIENKANGGTGDLANSDGWTAEAINNGWGVGDIVYLNENNKYWRHVNYGSVAIGANWDHYLSKGYWENGRWIESEHGYSGIKPKNPLPPLNYIEDTIAQMELEIPKILKEK